MIIRDQLANYLHDYLACDNFKDYAPNGLQIEGKQEIHTICTAVTASADTINKAIEMRADALLVHHGYFWSGEEPVIRGIKRNRIATLLANNINLYAYHLPLDCHETLGNNACLAELLEVDSVQKHPAGKIQNLLWTGSLKTPLTSIDFADYLHTKLKREPTHINGSNREIKTIAWCTGAAQDYLINAHHLGVDAYISGEVSERTYYEAIELGIHYYACGHHATERYGIQALGHHLSSQFGLEHQFIDSNNPV